MRVQAALLCILLSALLPGSVSAQDVTYRLKGGAYITKTQVDSIARANNNQVKYSFKKENGKQIVEVDTLSAIEQDTVNRQNKTTFSSTANTQNSPAFGTKTYKDDTGNIISADDYRFKMKSGEFQSRYQLQNNNGKYDVTYYLFPKKEAELQAKQNSDSLTNKLIGSRLPQLEFQTMDGKKITLQSLAGKVAVLNFWFVECKPCIAEMPALNELVQEYKQNPKVIFLALARDDTEQVKKFLEKTSFAYQVVPGANSYDEQLGVYAYPTQLVVSADGIIKDVLIGGVAADTKRLLTDAIEKALR